MEMTAIMAFFLIVALKVTANMTGATFTFGDGVNLWFTIVLTSYLYRKFDDKRK